MAAFLAGVVRAPITGLVLATEMTDSVSMLVPMLSACATAMLTPALIGDPPSRFESGASRQRNTTEPSFSSRVWDVRFCVDSRRSIGRDVCLQRVEGGQSPSEQRSSQKVKIL